MVFFHLLIKTNASCHKSFYSLLNVNVKSISLLSSDLEANGRYTLYSWLLPGWLSGSPRPAASDAGWWVIADTPPTCLLPTTTTCDYHITTTTTCDHHINTTTTCGYHINTITVTNTITTGSQTPHHLPTPVHCSCQSRNNLRRFHADGRLQMQLREYGDCCKWQVLKMIPQAASTS